MNDPFMELREALQILSDEIPGYFKIPVEKAGTYLPPQIDDFDLTRRITWNMWVDKTYYVGQAYTFFYTDPMDLEEFRDMARRDMAFTLLCTQHKSRRYLQEVLHLHRVQNQYKGFRRIRLTLGIFRNLWRLVFSNIGE